MWPLMGRCHSFIILIGLHSVGTQAQSRVTKNGCQMKIIALPEYNSSHDYTCQWYLVMGWVIRKGLSFFIWQPVSLTCDRAFEQTSVVHVTRDAINKSPLVRRMLSVWYVLRWCAGVPFFTSDNANVITECTRSHYRCMYLTKSNCSIGQLCLFDHYIELLF